jgi:hypothetical protein
VFLVIDGVEIVQSPGWWLTRLFNLLNDRHRRDRLQRLYNYHRGHAPLPQGAENAREAFEAFQKKARSNFAELIVSAMSERMTPTGFRTALDDDATGDAEVGQLWVRAGLDVSSADVHDLMLALGEAFVIVGPVDEETAAPIVTCEDPRTMVCEPDPVNPRRLLAALKVLHDDTTNEDRAYLYLPGAVLVAVRENAAAPTPSNQVPGSGVSAGSYTTHKAHEQKPLIINFDHRSWSWDPQRSGKLPHERMPVVRFLNKYALGEYETHIDLLDRINHQILQRMVIATMQAFRQRAVKGLPLVYPPEHPQAGTEIDYAGIFTADPAALWQLPATAEMWESAPGDLSQILSAVKDDLQHLAAVTRTPMHMLSPAGENQSAEGASLSREGLVFKVEDRIARTSFPWAQVMSLALLHAGQADRADLGRLQTIWAPAQRLSLAERADAASKLAGLLPPRTMLIAVFGMSPADADRTMTEIEDERLLAAQYAAQLAAAGANANAAAGGTSGSPAAGASTGARPAAQPPVGAPAARPALPAGSSG